MAKELYRGITVPAGVVPNAIDAEYPTHYSDYGKGGWHEVDTIEEMYALTDTHKKSGMAVYVLATKELYILGEDGTWTLFSGSGGSGGDLSDYYTKTQTDSLLNDKASKEDIENINAQLTTKVDTTTFEDYKTDNNLAIENVRNDLTTTATEINEAIGELDTRVEDVASKLVGVYRWCGNVANKDALASIENPSVGDVYNDLSTGANYGWTGSEWDNLGATFDFDGYTKSEADELLAEKLDTDVVFQDGVFTVDSGNDSGVIATITNGGGEITNQSIDTISSKGSRIIVNSEGAYYVSGDADSEVTAEDEIATVRSVTNAIAEAIAEHNESSNAHTELISQISFKWDSI